MSVELQPAAKRDRYGRYLLPDPDGGAKELPWTRVTTLAKSIADTFALTQWSERMVAKGISMRPDLYALASSTPVDDKDGLNRIAQQAKDAAAAGSGANLGTALHSFTEAVDRGEEPVVPAPWDRDVAAYRQKMADAGLVAVPGMIERIVVIPRYRAAGQLDRMLWRANTPRNADAPALIGDLKTAKNVTYSWTEIAIQLALYAHGAAIWNAITGQYEPMPAVDQDTAIVMHLPVGAARCDLWNVDIAAGWQAAELCHQVRAWRARKDLAQPLNYNPLANLTRAGHTNDLLAQIKAAGSVADLEALWADNAAAWTSSHTTAARSRKAELQTPAPAGR